MELRYGPPPPVDPPVDVTGPKCSDFGNGLRPSGGVKVQE
jgi:hypothetical protein